MDRNKTKLINLYEIKGEIKGESVTNNHIKITKCLKSPRLWQRLVNSLIVQNYFNYKRHFHYTADNKLIATELFQCFTGSKNDGKSLQRRLFGIFESFSKLSRFDKT